MLCSMLVKGDSRLSRSPNKMTRYSTALLKIRLVRVDTEEPRAQDTNQNYANRYESVDLFISTGRTAPRDLPEQFHTGS